MPNYLDNLDIGDAMGDVHGKNIIYIGDSYMFGPSDLTTALNQRLKVSHSYNFSYGSTGFVRDTDGKSFPHQLQNAASDERFNNSDITDIIIGGGINDVYTNSEGDYVAALTSIKNIVNANFPNAKVWLIPMLWGDWEFNVDDQRKYLAILNACINSGYAVYPNAYQILMGVPDVMLDTVHPNSRGCDLIARNITSWIDGGICDPEKYIVGNGYTVNNDVYSYTYLQRSGFLFCKLFLYIRTGIVTAGNHILECDDIMKDGLNTVNPCSKAVLAGNISGDFYIRNGKLYCTSDVSSCDVCLNACYPAGFNY